MRSVFYEAKMKRAEQKPIIEMNVSIIKGQLSLNINIPFKWLGIAIASLILWRAPELWKAIETVLSLTGK
jgi:hypothetical protein